MTEASMTSLRPIEGPLPTFISLDKQFLCLVCQNPLRTPVQTQCGHRMCKACSETLFDEREHGVSIPCPQTEDCSEQLTVDQIYPDFCAQRELRHHTVFCLNNDMGCPEKVKWKALGEHMNICPFQGKLCPYRDYGCNKRIPVKEFDKHIYTDCEFVPAQCEHCGMKLPKEQLKFHVENSCPEAPVICRYECGTDVLRKQGEEHQLCCHARPLKCQVMGCTFMGSSRGIARHMKDKAMDHATSTFNQAMKTMLEQNEGSKTDIAVLKSEVDTLKRDNATLTAHNGALKMTVDNQEDKIGQLTARLDALEEASKADTTRNKNSRGKGKNK